jgi:hypothetical protein
MSTDSNTITDVDPAAAHTAAVERHRAAVASYDAANSELSNAQAARDALLRSAVDGGVSTADVRQHEETIRTCESEVLLARAIVEGAARQRESAQINMLRAQAQTLTQDYNDAADARIALAARLDALRAQARCIINEYDAACDRCVVAWSVAGQHDVALQRIAGQENPTLRDLPSHQWPRCQNRLREPDRAKIDVAIVTRASGSLRALDGDLAPRERTNLGRPAPASGSTAPGTK